MSMITGTGWLEGVAGWLGGVAGWLLGVSRVWLLVLYLLTRCHAQHQIVTQDPFATLSSTLQTHQVAACDGERLELTCPPGTKISIETVEYGRQAPSSLVCPPTSGQPKVYTGEEGLDCGVRESVRVVEEACHSKKRCSILTSSSTLGAQVNNPCPGIRKYLEVGYKCKPSSFRSRVVCSGDMSRLSCPSASHRLAILSAKFGSASAGHIYCPLVHDFSMDQASREMELCVNSPATETMMDLCHGQRSCGVRAEPGSLGSMACRNLNVYMKTTYACVDKSIFMPRFHLQHNKTLTTIVTTTVTTVAPSVRTESGHKNNVDDPLAEEESGWIFNYTFIQDVMTWILGGWF